GSRWPARLRSEPPERSRRAAIPNRTSSPPRGLWLGHGLDDGGKAVEGDDADRRAGGRRLASFGQARLPVLAADVNPAGITGPVDDLGHAADHFFDAGQ